MISLPLAAQSREEPVKIVCRPWYSRPGGWWSLDLAISIAVCLLLFWAAFDALGWLVPVPRSAPLVAALICVALLFAWYRSLLTGLYDAEWRSVLGRSGYVIETPWPETPVASGYLQSQLLREGNPSFAIPSVPPTREQDRYFNWVKWPISFPRAARSWLLAVPWVAVRCIANRLVRGTFASKLTDDDVLRFMEGTSTCIFSELLEDGKTLRLAIPDQLPLCTWDGRRIAGFEIRADADARTITRCTFEGRSLIGDNDLIFAILILAMTHYQHTKSHLMAEQATLEIQRRGVRELAPSSRFTLALHDGLMHAKQSPLGGREAPLTATGVNRESVTASMTVHLPHHIDERKNRFRFYRFLARARVETIQLLKSHGLNVSAEAAFNNMVLHSVDHAEGARLMRGHIWTIDLSRGFASYLRSRFFSDVIAGPLTNPLVPERLCDLDPQAHPFYGELYERLRAIDPGYAEMALTSCSF